MARNTIKGLTVEIGGDTTKLGKALEAVNKKSSDLSSELGEINRLLKLDPGNTDLLAQKQKVLSEAVENTAQKLKTLKEAEKQVQKQFERGEVSEEQVRALRREILTTEKKLGGYEKAVKETAEAVEKLGKKSDEAEDGTKKIKKGADQASGSLDDLADSAEKAEDATDGLGAKLGGIAKGGLQALTVGVTALVGAMVASAEASRDYRAEMGKLDTAFTTAGHSSEAAQNTYKALQGVLGETDRAVEAANHLAKLTDSEKDLQKWTDICTGVYATFGASLPIEGLTEAANETAKVGQVTGPLADALNWAGVNEDKFNESLAACSNEQERQTLIMETLSGLYDEAAGKYRETNAEVIRANEANETWASTMADVGGAIDPVLTDVKLLGAAFLSDLVPGVKEVASAFKGMLNGDEGAAADMGAALSGIVTQLLTKLTEMAPKVVEMGIGLITSLASSLLQAAPQLLTTAGQIITNLVNGFQQNLPLVLAKGAELLTKLGEGIRTGLPQLVDQALDLVMKFATTIYDNAPKLIDMGFDLLSNLVQGILDSLPTLLSKAPEIISKFANVINDNMPRILKKGAELVIQIVKGIISAIPELVKNIPKILTAIIDVWEAFNWMQLGKQAFTAVKNGINAMVGSVKTAGQNVFNAVVNAIRGLPSRLLSFGKSAVSNLGNALRGALGSLKSAATSVFESILNPLKELPKKALSIGGDLVKGLWNGITDKLGWLTNKIKSFTNTVLDKIKGFFGVNSPSKETAWIGEMLDRGLAEGVEDHARDPIKAMARLSEGMLGEADELNGLTLERRLQHTFAPADVPTAETGMLGKLDKILAAIERGQVLTINGDTLVGATANKMNSALGQRRVLAERGAV